MCDSTWSTDYYYSPLVVDVTTSEINTLWGTSNSGATDLVVYIDKIVCKKRKRKPTKLVVKPTKPTEQRHNTSWQKLDRPYDPQGNYATWPWS